MVSNFQRKMEFRFTSLFLVMVVWSKSETHYEVRQLQLSRNGERVADVRRTPGSDAMLTFSGHRCYYSVFETTEQECQSNAPAICNLLAKEKNSTCLSVGWQPPFSFYLKVMFTKLWTVEINKLLI